MGKLGRRRSWLLQPATACSTSAPSHASFCYGTILPGVSQVLRKNTPFPSYPCSTLQETGCFPRVLLKSIRDSNVFWLVIGVLMTWKCNTDIDYDEESANNFKENSSRNIDQKRPHRQQKQFSCQNRRISSQKQNVYQNAHFNTVEYYRLCKIKA